MERQGRGKERTSERESEEWAEEGVEREHMVPLVLERAREKERGAQLSWGRREEGERREQKR